MAYAPRTKSQATANGKVAKSIATTRQKLRDNTERLQGPDVSGSASSSNYNTATRTGENTHLKITTCSATTSPEATRYDDIVELGGVKYHYPDQFEYTTDRSDRLNAWKETKANLSSTDAVNRTTNEASIVESYHAGPKMYQYTVEDNNQISMGGQVEPVSKKPRFSDGNRVQ